DSLFFFQAEDGIRDGHVTGVQTCALPICTTTEPYLLPTLSGVRTVPILTVGDTIHGYRMVGIPDGLGAFNSDQDDFTLIMNHERSEERREGKSVGRGGGGDINKKEEG